MTLDLAGSRLSLSVARELEARVGSEVALPGVLWSNNDQWWFRHDGVDIHLANRDAIPGASEMHGRAVTLHGTLARKPMPRIDQIALKPDRDLADAFVLGVVRVGDPPAPAIARCD